MNTIQQIEQGVQAYCAAVEHFDPEAMWRLWDESSRCTLISIARGYVGVESICRDFLINGIQNAYTSIKLIAEGVDVRTVTEDVALVLFNYHTECVRRADGSPYGIQGIETQLWRNTKDGWRLTHIHYSKES